MLAPAHRPLLRLARAHRGLSRRAEQILGVPAGASRAVLRERYYQLAKETHPDTATAGADGASFVAVRAAFEELLEASVSSPVARTAPNTAARGGASQWASSPPRAHASAGSSGGGRGGWDGSRRRVARANVGSATRASAGAGARARTSGESEAARGRRRARSPGRARRRLPARAGNLSARTTWARRYSSFLPRRGAARDDPRAREIDDAARASVETVVVRAVLCFFHHAAFPSAL